MAKRPAFVLSDAVEIELTDTTLSIKHDGDLVIEQTLGRALGTVEATGDVTIRLPKVTGTLSAGGTLTIEGAVEADSLRGKVVALGDLPIKCRAISASESIRIGAAKLQCDAIVAPHIDIDPKVSGRVTVIESLNDRPATKIKGGFSVSDYEDMFGDAHGFLAERGVQPLSGDADSSANTPTEDPAPEPVALAPTGADADDDDEEVDDPLSLSLDDLEPLVESEDKGDMQGRLTDALKRITSCYEGDDLPPAVSELRSLVEDGDMDALRQNITEVWNGLLGFHQKRGIRPHHQVTHAFNVIHSLVAA